MTPALIAITGADGFIGRATTAALGAAGFDLRLHGGPPAAARMSPRGQSLHDAFDLSADDAATRLGAQFDDAATVRGLRAFAARADHLLSR